MTFSIVSIFLSNEILQTLVRLWDPTACRLDYLL